jgi:hypothetical protein
MPDLGVLPKEPSGLGQSNPETPKKPSYPSFTLRDEQVDRVKSDTETCKVGEEYTATVKFRVSSNSDDNYGRSLGFDVVSIDGLTPAAGEVEGTTADETAPPVADDTDPDAQAETKTLGYDRQAFLKNKASAKKEVPKLSAKDLM